VFSASAGLAPAAPNVMQGTYSESPTSGLLSSSTHPRLTDKASLRRNYWPSSPPTRACGCYGRWADRRQSPATQSPSAQVSLGVVSPTSASWVREPSAQTAGL